MEGILQIGKQKDGIDVVAQFTGRIKIADKPATTVYCLRLTIMVLTFFLIILSAIALAAAFPPIDLEFLAWIGMSSFFFALDGKNRKSGFFLGLLWGFIFFMGTIYWVVNSMVSYGGIPFFTGALILILLALYLSLFFGMFGLGMAAMSSVNMMSPMLTILFAPSLWVALEYLRGNMIAFGFPWALLGYSQSTFLPLIQIADITGVYGISFLIVMVNAVIFFALSYWIGKEKRLPVKEGLLVFIILMVVLIYGLFRISEIDKVSDHWKTLRIAIVQGNIDQGRKWDASFQKQTVDIYRNLSLDTAKQGVRLIIWPETAVPFYLQSDKDLGMEIFNVPKQTNTYLLTGSPAYGPGFGGEVKYYNSAFLISPEGEIIGKYDKIHLVPFGEYVPLKKYLPFIHKLVVGVGDFTPGKWLEPLEFEGNSFGVLICFESIFPELARGFIKDGAGFLINITNDAWFGKTSAPYQHFSQAVFRAVENKVFLIRSANTGISGVIDPVGRVRAQSGIFTRETIGDEVKLRDARLVTFYSRYGDIFAIGCFLFVVGFCLLVVKRKRK